MQSMPGLASVHLSNGNLVYANAAFLSEFPACDLQDPGLTYLDHVNPQDKAEVLNAIGNPIKNQRPIVLKRHKVDEDNRSYVATYEMECSLYIQTETRRNDGFALVLCIFRDLTDTIDVLEQTRAKALEADRNSQEQSQCFTAMSHELRTPLNAILGFSELLEGKLAIPLADDKRVEYAGHIHQSAHHLLGLINGVLDLSKIKAGKFVSASEEVNLFTLLETTLESLQPIASAKQVALLLSADQDLPVLNTDPRAVRQIITNLISNAIKFSNSAGDVTVEVKRRRKTLSIEISDQGVGMDNQTLAKLGSVFFQAAHAISKDYEGTGLGLSIVYNLVEQLEGKIDVRSKLGYGSTFTVEIPISAAAAVPVPASPETDVIYLKKEQNAQVKGDLPIMRQSG